MPIFPVKLPPKDYTNIEKKEKQIIIEEKKN